MFENLSPSTLFEVHNIVEFPQDWFLQIRVDGAQCDSRRFPESLHFDLSGVVRSTVTELFSTQTRNRDTVTLSIKASMKFD